MNRDRLAVQYLSYENAETINACLCLCYEIFYGKNKHLETSDERVTKERLVDLMLKIMPDKELE